MFSGCFFRWTLWCTSRVRVRSFRRSWDNRGYLKAFGSPWMRSRFILRKIFNGLLFGGPMNVQAKVEVRSEYNCAYVKSWGTPKIRPSRSPKITDFGTNQKLVYEFLLVRSNLGPISYRFRDIAGFLSCWLLFNPNFGGVLVAPDGPCWGQVEQRP